MVDHHIEASRDAASPLRAKYKTAAWQRLRWSILVRDGFTCQRCGWEHPLATKARALQAIGRADLIEGRAPELVADHRRPHRGDEALFWADGNLQCLCKGCHDGAKQSEERSLWSRGGV